MDIFDDAPTSSPLSQSFSWQTQRLGAPPSPSPKPRRIVRDILKRRVISRSQQSTAVVCWKDVAPYNIPVLLAGLVLDCGESAAQEVFERILWLAQYLIQCRVELRKTKCQARVLSRQHHKTQTALEELRWKVNDQAVLNWDTRLAAGEHRTRAAEAARKLRLLEIQYREQLASAKLNASNAREEIQRTKQAVTERVKETKHQAAAYEDKVRTLETALQRSSLEAEEHRRRIVSLEAAIKQHVNAAQQAKEELSIANADFRKNLKDQERQLKAETAISTEDVRQQAMADAQQAHVKRIEEINAGHNEVLDRKENVIDELKEANAKVQGQVQDLNEQLEELEVQEHDARNEVEISSRKLDQLGADYQQSKRDLLSEVADLKSTVQSLQEHSERLTNERNRFEAQADGLGRENENMSSRLRQLEEESSAVSEKLGDLTEQLSATKEELQAVVEDRNRVIAQLQSEQNELAASSVKIKDLEQTKVNSLRDLEDKEKQHVEQLDALNARLTSLDGQTERSDRLLNEYRTQLERKTEELSHLITEKAEAAHVTAQLRRNLETANDTATEFTNRRRDLEASIAQLQEKYSRDVEALRAEISNSITSIDAAKTRVQELEREHQLDRESLTSDVSRLAHARDELDASLVAQRKKHETEIATLKDHTSKIDFEMTEAKSAIAMLENQHSAEMAAIQGKLQKDFARTLNELNSQHRKEIKSAQDALKAESDSLLRDLGQQHWQQLKNIRATLVGESEKSMKELIQDHASQMEAMRLHVGEDTENTLRRVREDHAEELELIKATMNRQSDDLVEQLKEQHLDELQVFKKQVNEHQEAASRFLKQLESTMKDKQSMSAELQDRTTELAKLTKEVTDQGSTHASELSAISADSDNLRQHVAELEDQIKVKVEQERELSLEVEKQVLDLSSIRNELFERETKYNQDTASWRAKVNECHSIVSQLEDMLKLQEGEKHALISETDALSSKLAIVHDEVATKEDLHAKALSSRNSEVDEQRRKTASLEDSLARVELELETRNGEIRDHIVSRSASDNELGRISTDLRNHQQERSRLEAALANVKRELADAREYRVRLEEQLGVSSTTMEDLQANYAQVQGKFSASTVQLEECKLERSRLDEELVTASKELEQDRLQLSSLQEELSASDIQMQQNRDSRVHLEHNITMLTSKLEILQNQQVQLEADAVASAARYRQLEEHAARVETVSKDSEEQLGTTTSELDDVRRQLTEQQDAAKAKHEEIERLNLDIEGQKLEVAKLHEALLTKTEELTQAQNTHGTKVAEMERELSTSWREKAELTAELHKCNAELSDNRAKVDKLDVSVNVMEADKQKLAVNLDEQSHRIHTLQEDYENKFNLLSAQLMEAQTTESALEADKRKLAVNLDEQSYRMHTLQADYEKKFNLLSAQLMEAQTTESALRHQVDEAKEQLRTLSEAHHLLELTKQELDRKVESLQQEVAKCTTDQVTSRQETEEAKRALGTWIEAYNILEVMRNELQNAIQSLERDALQAAQVQQSVQLEKEALQAEIKSLTQALEDARQGERDLHAKGDGLRKEIEDLKHNLSLRTESLQFLQADKETSDSVVHSLSGELRDALAAQKQVQIEKDALESEIIAAKQAMDATDKTENVLCVEREELLHTVHTLNQKVQDAQQAVHLQLQELQGKLTAAEGNEQQLRSENEALATELAALKDEHEADMAHLKSEAQAIRIEVNDAVQAERQLQAERDALSRELRDAQASKVLLEQNTATLSQEQETASLRNAQLEQAAAESGARLRDLKQQLTELREQAASSEKSVRQKDVELAALQSRHSTALGQIKSIEEVNTHNEATKQDLERQLKALQSQHSTALAQMKSMEKVNTHHEATKQDLERQLEALQSQHSTVLGQMKSIEEVKANNEATKQDLERQLEALRQRVNTVQAENLELETAHQLTQTELTTASERVADIEKTLALCQSELQSVQIRQGELQEELNNAHAESEHLRSSQVLLREEVSRLEQQLDESRSEVQSLQLRQSELQAELATEITERDHLRSREEFLREAVVRLDQRVVEAAQRNQTITQGYGQARADVEALQAVNRALEQDLFRDSTAREELERNLQAAEQALAAAEDEHGVLKQSTETQRTAEIQRLTLALSLEQKISADGNARQDVIRSGPKESDERPLNYREVENMRLSLAETERELGRVSQLLEIRSASVEKERQRADAAQVSVKRKQAILHEKQDALLEATTLLKVTSQELELARYQAAAAESRVAALEREADPVDNTTAAEPVQVPPEDSKEPSPLNDSEEKLNGVESLPRHALRRVPSIASMKEVVEEEKRNSLNLASKPVEVATPVSEERGLSKSSSAISDIAAEGLRDEVIDVASNATGSERRAKTTADDNSDKRSSILAQTYDTRDENKRFQQSTAYHDKEAVTPLLTAFASVLGSLNIRFANDTVADMMRFNGIFASPNVYDLPEIKPSETPPHLSWSLAAVNGRDLAMHASRRLWNGPVTFWLHAHRTDGEPLAIHSHLELLIRRDMRRRISPADARLLCSSSWHMIVNANKRIRASTQEHAVFDHMLVIVRCLELLVRLSVRWKVEGLLGKLLVIINERIFSRLPANIVNSTILQSMLRWAREYFETAHPQILRGCRSLLDTLERSDAPRIISVDGRILLKSDAHRLILLDKKLKRVSLYRHEELSLLNEQTTGTTLGISFAGAPRCSRDNLRSLDHIFRVPPLVSYRNWLREHAPGILPAAPAAIVPPPRRSGFRPPMRRHSTGMSDSSIPLVDDPRSSAVRIPNPFYSTPTARIRQSSLEVESRALGNQDEDLYNLYVPADDTETMLSSGRKPEEDVLLRYQFDEDDGPYAQAEPGKLVPEADVGPVPEAEVGPAIEMAQHEEDTTPENSYGDEFSFSVSPTVLKPRAVPRPASSVSRSSAAAVAREGGRGTPAEGRRSVSSPVRRLRFDAFVER